MLTISDGDFEQCFGRKPKESEWDNFVHYVKNGVDAQIDWDIIFECTRDLKSDILEEEDGLHKL